MVKTFAANAGANAVVEVIPGSGDSSLLAISFTSNEMQAMRESMAMAQRALDDMRTELAETRRERDRYIERVKLLEARLDAVRGVVK